MEEFLKTATIYIGVGEILVAGVLAYLFTKSSIPKQTIEQQSTLITALEKRIKQLEDSSKEDHNRHVENIKAIADLQGQIKVYKEIPLGDIASAMKDMNIANKEIAKSNGLILRTLQKSAVIADDDRDFLTSTNQTVEEQVVLNQTVTNRG